MSEDMQKSMLTLEHAKYAFEKFEENLLGEFKVYEVSDDAYSYLMQSLIAMAMFLIYGGMYSLEPEIQKKQLHNKKSFLKSLHELMELIEQRVPNENN